MARKTNIKPQTPPTSRNVRKQASLPRDFKPRTPTAAEAAAVDEFNALYDEGSDLPQTKAREYGLLQFMSAHPTHNGTGIENGGFAIDARYNAGCGWFGPVRDVVHYGGKSSRMFCAAEFSGWLLGASKVHYIVTHQDDAKPYGRGDVYLFDRYTYPEDLPGLVNPKCRSRIVLIVAMQPDETVNEFKAFELAIDSYDTNEAANAVRALGVHMLTTAKALGKAGLYAIAKPVAFGVGVTYAEGRSTVTPLKITPGDALTKPETYAALRPMREAAASYIESLNAKILKSPSSDDQ